MTLKWDMSKPIDMNEKTWRRLQITKYVIANPDYKPKDISPGFLHMIHIHGHYVIAIT